MAVTFEHTEDTFLLVIAHELAFLKNKKYYYRSEVPNKSDKQMKFE